MRTVNQWLNEYGESHKNKTNKSIHWICVPAIFFSIMGLFYGVKLPWHFDTHTVNVAMIIIFLLTIYYLRLSIMIGIGMLIFGVACLFIAHLIEKYVSTPLWLVCVIIFILAWIGQFYGHHVEGKKPSFFKDLQFLLIGPMWLLSFVYKVLGVRY